MRIQWRYLDIATQSNTRMFDLELGRAVFHEKPRCTSLATVARTAVARKFSIRIMRRCPVDSPYVKFVRKSIFTMFCIVHPQGGNAARFRCEECGADYPYGSNPSPCANCAIERESGIRITLGKRMWQKVWSV